MSILNHPVLYSGTRTGLLSLLFFPVYGLAVLLPTAEPVRSFRHRNLEPGAFARYTILGDRDAGGTHIKVIKKHVDKITTEVNNSACNEKLCQNLIIPPINHE